MDKQATRGSKGGLKWGVNRRWWNLERDAAIVADRAAGASLQEIADMGFGLKVGGGGCGVAHGGGAV